MSIIRIVHAQHHKKKVEVLFTTLIDRFKKDEYPFDRSKPPQEEENMPKTLPRGGAEHALFLFCVCYYMRGGIESDTALASLGVMYDLHPELFVPAHFIHEEEAVLAEKIRVALVEVGLNFRSNSLGKHWVQAFRKFHYFWGGNPLNLFREFTDKEKGFFSPHPKSYVEICERIINKRNSDDNHPYGFACFREKMVSMLSYFFVHAKLLPDFLFPVPVDFHVLRMLLSHRILIAPDREYGQNVLGEQLLEKARNVTERYCEQHQIPSIVLADALWLYSRAMCKAAPGNQSIIGKRRARKTKITQKPVVWTRTSIEAYNRTCGLCPVRTTCRSNISSAPYYITGQMIMHKKVEPPPKELFPQGKLVPPPHNRVKRRIVPKISVPRAEQLKMSLPDTHTETA